MLGTGSQMDTAPPPGGIAWLDISAETSDSGPVRARTGPLGLQIARIVCE